MMEAWKYEAFTREGIPQRTLIVYSVRRLLWMLSAL
jgi:hypothetical protein